MGAADFFREHGYYVAKGVFTPDEVAELEADFDRIVDQLSASGENINARWSGPEMDRVGAEGTVVLHTHNVQTFSAVWHRAFLHPKFLAVTSELLGENIILHHSKLFVLDKFALDLAHIERLGLKVGLQLLSSALLNNLLPYSLLSLSNSILKRLDHILAPISVS